MTPETLSAGRAPWLFSPVLDRAMLAIPFLGTLIGFALSQRDLFGPASLAYAAWVSQFVLGDTTHVILTFLLLGTRRETLNPTPRQSRVVLFGAPATFVAVLSIYFFLDRIGSPLWDDLFLALVLTLATHHRLSQAKGIWSLYSLRAHKAPSTSERKLQSAYVPLGLILVMVRWLYVANGPHKHFPFVVAVRGMEALLPFEVTYLIAAIWLAFAATTIHRVAVDFGKSPKTFYVSMSAFGVLAMIVVPVWGSILVGALHGFEYFLLSHRMLQPLPDETTRLGPGLIVPAMLVSILPILAVGVFTGPFFIAVPPAFAAVALSTVNAIVLSHYFTDAFIYRFRIPEVRRVALRRLRYVSPGS